VLRGFARSDRGATLGGGRVLDAAPPRRRRSDPALAAELARLAAGGEREALALRIQRAGLAGVASDALARETGLEAARLEALLAELAAEGAAQATRGAVWLGAAALASLEGRLQAALAQFHEQEPLRPGMPRRTAEGALPENRAEGAFELVVARLAAAGRVDEVGDALRLAHFVPVLTREQEAIAARVRAECMAAGLEPPTFAGLLAEHGCGEATLRNLLGYLERDGSLVRAPGDLWFDRVAVDALRERVLGHLRARGSLETSAYKDLIGTSRKYAVPLMELFDAERLTLRTGELRILRGSATPSAPPAPE
jgi:selenocysteine-specific elongation factor